jgi:hypothetical protein
VGIFYTLPRGVGERQLLNGGRIFRKRTMAAAEEAFYENTLSEIPRQTDCFFYFSVGREKYREKGDKFGPI